METIIGKEFMKLEEDIYIAGGYLVEFDEFGQFRIFGPNNHLYLGLVDVPRHSIRIDSIEEEDRKDSQKGQGARIAGVKIKGAFTVGKLNLYLPVMGDVRTLREITVEFKEKTFLQLRESQHTLHGEAQPMRVEFLSATKNPTANPKSKIQNPKLIFRRDYGEYYYQSSFEFPALVEVKEIEKPYKGFALRLKTRSKKWKVRSEISDVQSGSDDNLKNLARAKKFKNSKIQKISLQSAEGANPTSHIAHPTSQTKSEIPFVLRCETNDTKVYNRSCVLLGKEAIDFSVFGKQAEKIRRFWERTKVEVEHMLCWAKTSGDRFGTVFPRDWMEAAALGVGDIPPAGIDYMLKKSLAHVNEKGEAWHEDVVGEFKYKHQAAGYDLFDRKMIDIEPWYLICLRWVTERFWKDKEAVGKIAKVATYVLKQAKEKEYITFKKLPAASQARQAQKQTLTWQKELTSSGFYEVGDWRDSKWAYKRIHPIIAPFSVSAVLYPQALVVIRQIWKILQQIDGVALAIGRGELEELIETWQKKKQTYKFQLARGLAGFALALYDSWKKLKVHHLDEAYLYFLSDNFTKQDILSFAKRLLSLEYFYTDSGPLLIARNNNIGYTDEEYHGLVIWTKQAAFAVAGLARALKRDLNLTKEERELLKKAAKKTAQSLIKAYCQLDSIPELHKDENGKASVWGSGAGSSVQLWSAIGARRIFREYVKLNK